VAQITVEAMGQLGVCVDKDPLELDDNELYLAQNAISVVESGRSALRKRPGLIVFNMVLAAGSVLGGVSVPLPDLSAQGVHYLYIGRGPTS
jgi:hypothetical protein